MNVKQNKNKYKKRMELLNRQKKIFYRTVRSKLKQRIYRGGKVSRRLRKKYNLKVTGSYVEKARYHRQGLEVFPIKIPKKFCFFADPVGTNNFFKDLRKTICKKKPYDYHISHENTDEIGLAASFLFDQLLKDERTYWGQRGIVINFSGRISNVSKVNNFLLSYGLLKELGIPTRKFPPNSFDQDYGNKYITLKMQGSKKNLYQKSQASCLLVEYFDQCFRYNGMTITPDAQRDLIDSIGEIIGNAEEHCGKEDGQWYALGCYNKENHNCTFAIINYGRTIYENLSNKNSTAATVINRIKKIIDSHRPFLEKTYGKLTKAHEEPIWNVMALQDGISSLRTSAGRGRTRGQGIMDVLHFIEIVKSKNSVTKISLISGASAIIIDYAYPIIEKPVGEGKEIRRIITFNKEQDLRYPPDKRKVLTLKDKFEGTIFAGSFIIDKKYLLKSLEKKHGKGN